MERDADQSGGVTSLYLPPELYNVMAYLDLFTLCTEGKHEVTEAKAQTSVMDLHNIASMTKEADACWPLKSSIGFYLEQVFLVTEKDDQFADKDELKMLQSIIEVILNDIDYYLSSEQEYLEGRRFVMPDGKALSFTNAASEFVYGCCIPMLHSFIKLKIDAATDLMEWIAKSCCQLYYNTEEPDRQKGCYQVLTSIYNNQTYSHVLDGLSHPLNDAPIQETKSVINRIVTNYRENLEQTKALKLSNRLSYLD